MANFVETEMWDQEDLDLVGPAYIGFTGDGLGSFRLVAVEGWIDTRRARERSGVEFSWDGNDDGKSVGGRGWAEVAPDGSLIGHLFLHLGDDSSFQALLDTPARRRPTK